MSQKDEEWIIADIERKRKRRETWFNTMPGEKVTIGTKEYEVVTREDHSIVLKTLTGRNAGQENTLTREKFWSLPA